MSGGDWLEELEARLEQQLDAFLRTNPEQEALLANQEARDRQRRLNGERRRLQQDAELQRQGLLQLASEIRQWRQRVLRARTAGAGDLAARAEAHIAELMEQGRQRWTSLAEMGQRFAEVERQLGELNVRPTAAPGRAKAGRGSSSSIPDNDGSSSHAGPAASGPSGSGLESDWAAFEAQQELEELQRRMGR